MVVLSGHTNPPDGKFQQQLSIDEYWMDLALQQAREAIEQNEVPVGAVLIGKNGLLAAAGNSPIRLADPSAHAEILAIRRAAQLVQNYRLPETTMYVTLEPCIMCMGALIHARINRLVYGAADPKTGAATSLYTIGNDHRLNHTITVTTGVLADQCAELLKNFFKKKRGENLGEIPSF
ncbi:MAG: tRNA adenosine(34) deaminase TadA [Proteobacteria bacterium]|nr:tRNA adenosine(34) deaminase TadA [Pseudomonadota bacterium]